MKKHDTSSEEEKLYFLSENGSYNNNLELDIEKNHNLKSNQFLNLTLKNTTIPHDCEMLEYWTEKTFPDGST